MSFKVYATNQPDTLLEVDEPELIDLARLGLLVKGKGDITDKGRLKRTADVSADEAADVNASLPTDTTTTSTGQGA